jgi:DHA2 family multidrug resistance protein
LALFAITATFAPAIGPTVGGYLTEAYGWQYIFFINVIPGTLILAVPWLVLERKPMRLHLLAEGDWLGIATMAIGLAALQTVLDEGNKDNWFDSLLIVRLSLTAAVSLVLFVWIELVSARPAVNLRSLWQRNFSFGTIANLLLGFSLYGTVYILPQYLGQVFGYNAEQIGFVLAWTGFPQLLIIPLVPLLMKRLDARVIVAIGLSVVRSKLLHGRPSVGRFRGRRIAAAEHRPLAWTGGGARATVSDCYGRNCAPGFCRRLRALQPDAKPRRRIRDCAPGRAGDKTRTTSLQCHRQLSEPVPGKRPRAAQ